MNSLLKVNLRFRDEDNPNRGGFNNLRLKRETSIETVDMLIDSLTSVKNHYMNVDNLLDGLLIDVYYNDIIAKSNRIKRLLKPRGKEANDLIVGARFSDAEEGEENHIITYYVKEKTVDESIQQLEVIRKFLVEELDGCATRDNFNEYYDPKKKKTITKISQQQYDKYNCSKKQIRELIVDCSVIETIRVPRISTNADNEEYLVTFYKTEKSTSELLDIIDVDKFNHRYSFYGEDTILVSRDLYNYLNEKIPYLISMVSPDLSKINYYDLSETENKDRPKISSPKNEPVIGVIDTLFDENVYFSEWVENYDYLDDVEKSGVKNEHRVHGTEVSSIIVDGPNLNPWLDDNCGRFRVRHFGVCLDKISTSRLVRKIKEIVDKNPDIHVWNLSLGTEEEVSKNFISYDGAVLDELQAKKNVIFIVAGTNDNRIEKNGRIRIGSPADSLNSIVVNSVRKNGEPASFSREGAVLSFFNKPDISYYGGDIDEKIKVMSPRGECEDYGTSLAAPWISRKMAFLIDVIGLPREVAKALLIDSAAGWEFKQQGYKMQKILGYGIVPISINNILCSEDSEIKFYLYGTSKSYKTSNYSIPIPKDKDGKYPYIARTTLCYFPHCSRTQGVDYTNRELSLKFGRVKNNDAIDDINDNVQDEDGFYTDERRSRAEFRKWENTKFISKVLKKNRAVKSYEDRAWAFTVTSKERALEAKKEEMNFGAIVTLREINGIDRISDFITLCEMRGWIVNEINMENKIDEYINNQEEIVFTE